MQHPLSSLISIFYGYKINGRSSSNSQQQQMNRKDLRQKRLFIFSKLLAPLINFLVAIPASQLNGARQKLGKQ